MLACLNPWAEMDCNVAEQQTDPDDIGGEKEPGSWSIIAGNVGTPWPVFYIEPNNGRIGVSELATAESRAKYLNTEQFEEHALVVRYTDNGGLSSDANIVVKIEDQAERPYFKENPNIETRYVDEEAGVDTIVGVPLKTDDPDDGDADNLVYSIISQQNTDGGNVALFKVDEVTGQVLVAKAGKLNYETMNQYTVVLGIKDESNLTESATLIIQINDLNEAPFGTVSDFYIREDASPNDIATVSSKSLTAKLVEFTDEDTGKWGSGEFEILRQTFEKWDNDAELYVATETEIVKLDSTSGGFMLTETAGIDFELYEEYQIDMRFTDGGGLVDEFKVNVQIVDVGYIFEEFEILPRIG